MATRNTRERAFDRLTAAFASGRLTRRELAARAAALGLAGPALAALARRQPALAQEATLAADQCGPFGTYQGKTLRVSVALAEDEVPVFQQVVSDFEGLTKGKVDLLKIEAADVVRTLAAQVKSGKVQIDLLTQDNNQLAPLVNQGLVEPLPEAEKLMPPTTIASLKPVLQFNGQYYFLPARPNVQITYYNERVFNQIGVQPPKTWDDVMAAGKKIQETQGVGKVSIQAAPGGPLGVTVTQFLWQAGGDPLHINSAEGNHAFEFMQQLKPYLTPQYPTASFDTTNTYLLNESVVLAQNWPFGVNVIVGKGGKKEVKTYAGWAGPSGNHLVLGGDVFGIAKGTPNRDFALDFARHFMCRKVQEQLTAQLGWPAMRTDAFGAVQEWQQPYFETVRQALEVAQPRPNLTYWPQVENILSNAFNDVVTRGAPVKDTLDRYQQEIDKLQSAASS